MKKYFLAFFVFCLVLLLSSFNKEDNEPKPIFIEPSVQRTGDSALGYLYLTTGNFLKSGMPYDFFITARGEDKHNYLGRTLKNATVEQGFNVVSTPDSMDIVIPTCLQCHAEVFEGNLVMGLGNASADFTSTGKQNTKFQALKMWQMTSPKKYKAVSSLIRSMITVNPGIETEVRGVNPADKLAAILVAHRDPQTLQWSDKAMLDVPDEVIPTDVPAWWLLRKKNAMFYTGFGRGDFSRFLMMSNLLTVKDTSEAREVNSHFGDVLAFIKTIKPPPYPKPVKRELAALGKIVFTNNCQRCHGSYGEDSQYPNLLIPGSIIQTDSALYLANQQAKQFLDWFDKSWFAQGADPARLVPANGYVAPPLDGVWITAPYLHNGSVPTIEAVLNSKIRPVYWTRNFSQPEYDYEHLGWKYETKDQPDGKKAYNTTLRGYGNSGHYFGDDLTDAERTQVIEYLKTL